MKLPDHPEITWALRTGYPSWLQPNERDEEGWDDDDDDDDDEEAEYEF